MSRQKSWREIHGQKLVEIRSASGLDRPLGSPAGGVPTTCSMYCVLLSEITIAHVDITETTQTDAMRRFNMSVFAKA